MSLQSDLWATTEQLYSFTCCSSIFTLLHINKIKDPTFSYCVLLKSAINLLGTYFPKQKCQPYCNSQTELSFTDTQPCPIRVNSLSPACAHKEQSTRRKHWRRGRNSCPCYSSRRRRGKVFMYISVSIKEKVDAEHRQFEDRRNRHRWTYENYKGDDRKKNGPSGDKEERTFPKRPR